MHHTQSKTEAARIQRIAELTQTIADANRELAEVVANSLNENQAGGVSPEIDPGAVRQRPALSRDWTALAFKQRLLLDAVGEGILGLDRDGRIIFENAASAAAFGREEHECLGRPIGSLLHPIDAEPQARSLSSHPIFLTLGDGQVRRMDTGSFHRKDGSRFLVDFVCSPVRAVAGAVAAVVVCFRDVSERRKAEESLRASEANLARAQAIAHLGSWEHPLTDSTDPAGDRLRWSDEVYRIFGVSRPEFDATYGSFLAAVHPVDREAVQKAQARVLSGGSHLNIEHRIVRPDGTIRWVHEQAELGYGPDGRPALLTGTVLDITERKEAEEKYRAIFENAIEGIYQSTPEGRYITVNPAFARILGYESPEEIIRVCQDIGRQAYVNLEDRERFKRLMATDGVVKGLEHEARRKDGSVVWVSLNGRAIRNADGAIVLYEGTIEDISARKSAEHAVRQKDTLLRIAGHLGRIGGWSADVEENQVDWSPEIFEILEWPDRAAPTLSGAMDYYSGDGRVKISEALASCAGQGTAFDLELLMRTARGKVFWARSVGIRGIDAGQKFRVYGALQDISAQKQALEAIRASEASLIRAQEIARLGNWEYEVGSRKLSCSIQALQLFGIPPGGFHGDSRALLSAVHPADRERTRLAAAAALAGANSFSFEQRVVLPGGAVRALRTQGAVARDPSGMALRLSGTVQDISDQKQAETALNDSNRALRMRSRCSAALIRSDDEAELLVEICRIAVEIGGFRLAWIGYARNDAAKSVAVQAHAGQQTGYLEEIDINWSETSPQGQGPVGRAIRSGLTEVVTDIAADPTFAPWRELARATGIFGVAAVPLKSGVRTFGVLALYLSEVRAFQADEMRLLQELAEDTAFGIANLRSQSERRRMEVAVRKMASSVSASANDQFFRRLAENMTEALDGHAGIVARFLPGEPLTVRTMAVVVEGRLRENVEFTVPGTLVETLAMAEDGPSVSNLGDRLARALPLPPHGSQAHARRLLINSSGQPVGFLWVTFPKALDSNEFTASTLQIFSSRAAAEFDRLESDAVIREQASLLDKATDAILVRDLEHRVLFWNNSAERIYGWSRDEVLGKSTREMLYPEALAFDAGFQALLKSGEWLGELRKKSKSGKSIIVDCRWTLMRGERGEPKSVLSIETDITEKKRLETQFLRVQRMESIGTLAGGIAHDLNNVLAPIMMSVDFLSTNLPDEEKEELLQTLRRNVQRGANLVKQVLQFARGVEGQRIDVDPLILVKDIAIIIRDTFPKSIRFELKATGDLWHVLGDPTQLHQVILNLCVNSRDAMPRGGSLSVTLENLVIDDTFAASASGAPAGPYVNIAVADTGHGIPLEIQDRVFEPFFTTKEVGKGTGLGLSSSLAIVKSHRGFINLYSEPGKGAVFKVYIPASATGEATEAVSGKTGGLPRGHGEVVLVVDDEAPIREVTKTMLERFGYKVLLASNGAEAVSLYASNRDIIALVLTDIAMPVLDGAGLISAILQINPGVKIIATSGLSSQADLAGTAAVGVHRFIPKPYSAKSLLEALNELLGPPRLQEGRLWS